MFETMHFKESEMIYSKGLLAEGIFMVKTGSVSLSKDGSLIYKQVRDGGYLELEKIINQLPFEFDAICNTKTEILYVPLRYLDVYVKEHPLQTIEMLSLLTEELEAINDKLLSQNQKDQFYNAKKGVQILKNEDHVEIKSERSYRKVLPAEHHKYLFDKDIVCPVCGINFKVNQIRFSQLELDHETRDFRHIYKDIDELWYQLWRCPYCHYTNFGSEFFKINNLVRNELKISLPRYKMNHELVLVKSNIQQVFADIYQMNVILERVTKSSFVKARLWQSYAWLLEDVNDYETAKHAREILLNYLEDAWYNSTSSLDPDDEIKLALKLAMLSYEFGNIKNARDYILQGVRVKTSNKSLKQRAQDLMYEIKKG
ncbi:DUF2225 domain-containing protein [Fusibacter ferrireducens]|uniref:DUF2225 domain-containing protein n=1 Tax=Fusibacter ferrireducens TaxID=2785058 RepID=A0ABR9ZT84_9FIRM|nr:DUF2225 domain-containing protein [Fusibacter ferrireducens]MBF4693561.1 DUF2225 domain-containing protein [Fusibacter ferrireducens]